MDMTDSTLYNPYGCGMTASHAVEALWRAAGLPETLKSYTKIISSTTPPAYSEADNDNLFWYCTTNNKLYRATRNTYYQILIWFEV